MPKDSVADPVAEYLASAFSFYASLVDLGRWQHDNGRMETAGTLLTGVSCYCAVTGSIESGEAYQEALENL